MSRSSNTKTTKYTIVNLAICVLLCSALVLAFLRSANNLVKIVTEDKDWIVLSEEERREKAYGQLYEFSKIILQSTKGHDELLFITTDNRAYYLAKYFLYPRRVVVINPTADVDRGAQYAAILVPSCNVQYAHAKKAVVMHFTKLIYENSEKCEAIYKK